MTEYHSERLLILTKTYPAPSKKYRETSCIAAINENGDLRRLFPIPFRLLDGEYQFQRWEWIEAKIAKARNDHRPESFKIDIDSIKRLGKIGTDAAWSERLGRIRHLILDNFSDLETLRQHNGNTLGFIQPIDIQLHIKPATSQDWTEDERAKLIQDGLFDSPEVRARIPLRKIPYDFYYKYQSSTPGNDNENFHKITDWEAGALYWNCVSRYGNMWEDFFRKKLEDDFSKKDLLFLMGTMHRFPDQWLIVGLVYPPKVEARQIPMLLAPDV